ncbi:MAG: triphosphoribosyl-dephospho-CoA synthase [Methylococcaceae bacterium]
MSKNSLRSSLEYAYLEACEAELRAFKPGNVSVHAEGHDMTVEQFRVSAKRSAPWLVDENLSLGEKIFYAVETTVSAVGCNTNLGIVLLAAPLLKAAVEAQAQGVSLREALTGLLGMTTVQDADWVYRAIRLANPGGLGKAEQHDVINPPHVKLEEAMYAAKNRDRIAYQYVNCYTDVFDLAVPSYHYALSRFGSEDWAVLSVFTNLLKNIPDSHIERKFGSRHHPMVTDRMIRIDQAMSASADNERLEPLLREIDTEFKQLGINPGTTADLTVACVLAVRLERVLGQGRPCAESGLIV